MYVSSAIVKTPFGIYCAISIFTLSVFRNYAILTVECQHGFGNLRQSHFGNIARCKAESIQGFLRIEIDNITEIVIIKIRFSVNAESCHNHKSNAVTNKLSVH